MRRMDFPLRRLPLSVAMPSILRGLLRTLDSRVRAFYGLSQTTSGSRPVTPSKSRRALCLPQLLLTSSVNAGNVLRSAFTPSNQQLRSIFIDFIWRLLWSIFSLGILLFAGAGVFAQMSSLEWQGPDLDASNPIIVLAALQAFWKSYGAVLLAGFGLLLLVLAVLWITLEALFRGGWKGLWI